MKEGYQAYYCYTTGSWAEEDNDHGVIFTVHPVIARIRFAWRTGMDIDSPDLRVVPKPVFDKFAEQNYVPAKDLFDNFWNQFCEHCQREISITDVEESQDLHDNAHTEVMFELLPPLLNPQFRDRLIFCNKECTEAYDRNKQIN